MSTNKLGYRIVSKASPRLTVRVTNKKASSIVTTGDNRLYVKRVGEAEFAYYEPVEIQGLVFTFVFDDVLFDNGEGRYEGRLLYKGTELGTVQFQLEKAETKLEVR